MMRGEGSEGPRGARRGGTGAGDVSGGGDSARG